jgi:[protein-PII] uridylyltransferase
MSPVLPSHEPTTLFDPDAVIAEFQQLVTTVEGEPRTAIAQRLKAVLAESCAKAEALLLKERHGGRCAARLCRMQDDIIRVIYTFAVTHLYPSRSPSEGERMAIVATGGYGRGLMAPGSDIDLLFVLPYKQTAWSEQIAEAILYCLWDMGLKVGHATRSID